MAFPFYILERKGEQMADIDTKECNECIQRVQTTNGPVQIDYRALSHKPGLDTTLLPYVSEEDPGSRGLIADAGAVGSMYKKVVNMFQRVFNIFTHNGLTENSEKGITERVDDLEGINAERRITLLEQQDETNQNNIQTNSDNISKINSEIGDWKTSGTISGNIESLLSSTTTLNNAVTTIQGLLGTGDMIEITDWNIFSDQEENLSLPEDKKYHSGWYYSIFDTKTSEMPTLPVPIASLEHTDSGIFIIIGNVRKVSFRHPYSGHKDIAIDQTIYVFRCYDGVWDSTYRHVYSRQYYSDAGYNQRSAWEDITPITSAIGTGEFKTLISTL